MRYHDGPISKMNPFSFHTCALPPGWSFFSNTVTFHPSLANRAAAAKPPKPEPTTINSFPVIVKGNEF